MKIYIWVITILQIATGILFLSLAESDIQLGFGLVLLFMGLANIPNAIKK